MNAPVVDASDSEHPLSNNINASVKQHSHVIMYSTDIGFDTVQYHRL